MLIFDFIFMKRKLAEDEANMISNMKRSKKSNSPMWLLLFPEGTGTIGQLQKKPGDGIVID